MCKGQRVNGLGVVDQCSQCLKRLGTVEADPRRLVGQGNDSPDASDSAYFPSQPPTAHIRSSCRRPIHAFPGYFVRWIFILSVPSGSSSFIFAPCLNDKSIEKTISTHRCEYFTDEMIC